jgi:hypothetical protein
VSKVDVLGVEGARETVRATVEADPWATLEELRVAGQRKAKAEAQANHLKHMRRVVLSRLQSEIAQAQSNKSLSEAKLERMARADSRYEDHLKGLAAAQQDAEQASAEFWRLKAELDWQDRTLMFAMSLAKLQR